MLNKHLPNPENLTLDTVGAVLKGLGELEWRLHKAPWCYLLLIHNAKGKWTMRSEQRKPAVHCGRKIQEWVIGLDELNQNEVEDLRKFWESLLIPPQSEEECDTLWQQVENMKAVICNLK